MLDLIECYLSDGRTVVGLNITDAHTNYNVIWPIMLGSMSSVTSEQCVMALEVAWLHWATEPKLMVMPDRSRIGVQGNVHADAWSIGAPVGQERYRVALGAGSGRGPREGMPC